MVINESNSELRLSVMMHVTFFYCQLHIRINRFALYVSVLTSVDFDLLYYQSHMQKIFKDDQEQTKNS